MRLIAKTRGVFLKNVRKIVCFLGQKRGSVIKLHLQLPGRRNIMGAFFTTCNIMPLQALYSHPVRGRHGLCH